jgi:hypothetical protein
MHFTWVFVALLAAAPAAGQGSLEIIPLRHRTADQVLPSLRPLMEPGATLTAQGTQLIVRTSPANLAELRRALEAIDRPARRLQISVRLDDALERSAREAGVSGRIGERGSSIDIRANERETRSADRVDQRIQVLEGGRAHIYTGRESLYRETASGFEAMPRLAGNTVMVDLIQRRETPAREQGFSTTVSARLGEWFEVGGVLEQASRSDRGLAARSSGAFSEARRIWLKVDEVR